MWYCEEKNLFGLMVPTMCRDEPTGKSQTGVKQSIHNKRKLPDSMVHIPLDDLFNFLNGVTSDDG